MSAPKHFSENVFLDNTDLSTSISTGSLIATGGLGITKNIVLGSDITATPSLGSYFTLNSSTFTDSSTAGSGTLAFWSSNYIGQPTLVASNSSVTTTSASSLFIVGPPVASTNETITNAYALNVNSGDSYFGNNIGIGVSPTYQLDVNGISRFGDPSKDPGIGRMRITGSYDTGVYLRISKIFPSTWGSEAAFNATRYIQCTGDAENTVEFNVGAGGVGIGYAPPDYNHGSQVLYVNGYVGIGTNNPGSPLHVAGTISTSPTGNGVHMGTENSHAAIQLNHTNGGYIDFANSGGDADGRILYTHSSDEMAFYTGTIARLTLAATTSTFTTGVACTSLIATGAAPLNLTNGNNNQELAQFGKDIGVGNYHVTTFNYAAPNGANNNISNKFNGYSSYMDVYRDGRIQFPLKTASTALALDASKNLTSITNTGTGDNVLSISPTLTGTPVISSANVVIFQIGGTASSARIDYINPNITTESIFYIGKALTANNSAHISYDISVNKLKMGIYGGGDVHISDTGTILLGNSSVSGAGGSAAYHILIYPNTFTDSGTAISGTLSDWSSTYIGQTTLAASNTSVTTTTVSTLRIAGAPIAGTNETLTNAYALYVESGVVQLGSVAVKSGFEVGGKLNVDSGVFANGWFRNVGASGWFNETYGGGWYMDDANWVKSYQGKGISTTGTISGNYIAANAFQVASNIAITSQGGHLQWNRSNGEGETWLINQQGGSPTDSGIRFGASTTGNVVTEWARFQNNGYFGIGMTPTAQLTVKANATVSPATNGILCYQLENNDVTKHAIIAVRTNGALSGDAFFSMDINGQGGWSMGIDNSDSDKFKISNAWDSVSSATKLTIDSAGAVNIPGTLTTGSHNPTSINASGTITGVGITSSSTTDATSYTSGGAFTSAGGGSFAKRLIANEVFSNNGHFISQATMVLNSAADTIYMRNTPDHIGAPGSYTEIAHFSLSGGTSLPRNLSITHASVHNNYISLGDFNHSIWGYNDPNNGNTGTLTHTATAGHRFLIGASPTTSVLRASLNSTELTVTGDYVVDSISNAGSASASRYTVQLKSKNLTVVTTNGGTTYYPNLLISGSGNNGANTYNTGNPGGAAPIHYAGDLYLRGGNLDDSNNNGSAQSDNHAGNVYIQGGISWHTGVSGAASYARNGSILFDVGTAATNTEAQTTYRAMQIEPGGLVHINPEGFRGAPQLSISPQTNGGEIKIAFHTNTGGTGNVWLVGQGNSEFQVNSSNGTFFRMTYGGFFGVNIAPLYDFHAGGATSAFGTAGSGPQVYLSSAAQAPAAQGCWIGSHIGTHAGLTGQTVFNNAKGGGTGGWEWNDFDDSAPPKTFVKNAMYLKASGDLYVDQWFRSKTLSTGWFHETGLSGWWMTATGTMKLYQAAGFTNLSTENGNILTGTGTINSGNQGTRTWYMTGTTNASAGSSTNYALPGGCTQANIISITGIIVNTNSDIIPFSGVITGGVDYRVDSYITSGNLNLTPVDANSTSKTFKVTIITNA